MLFFDPKSLQPLSFLLLKQLKSFILGLLEASTPLRLFLLHTHLGSILFTPDALVPLSLLNLQLLFKLGLLDFETLTVNALLLFDPQAHSLLLHDKLLTLFLFDEDESLSLLRVK